MTLALLIAAAPAQAYKLGGKRWPGRTITYHSVANKWAFAIEEAAKAWNESGARIRFKQASRSRARLHIGYEGPVRGIAGRATLGWASPAVVYRTAYPRDPVARQRFAVDLPPVVPCGARFRGSRVRCERGPRMWLQRPGKGHLSDPDGRRSMVTTVAHEFGHVLGLRHVSSKRCALMAFDGQGGCEQPEPWEYTCAVLRADDVRGAIARYGGSARPLGPELCERSAPPVPVTGLTVTYDPQTTLIHATWTDVDYPSRGEPVSAIQRDTCPGDPSLAYSSYEAGSQSYNATDGPGRYCVSVWARDTFGRHSEPVSAFVEVPAPADEF